MKRIVPGLLLFALASSGFADPAATPGQVVRQFMAALADGDDVRALALVGKAAAPMRQIVREEAVIRCIEVSSLHVMREQAGAERAEVDITAVIRRVPRGKGRATADLERRRFTLKPEEGAWRIEWMVSAEDLLVEEIMKSPQDARRLIAEHPELIGPQLVQRMVSAAAAAGPRDFRKVQREIVDVALNLAGAIDDRAGVAYAMAAQLIHDDVPGADRSSRLARAKEAFRIAQESDVPEVVYVNGITLATVYTQFDDGSREGERVYRRTLEYRGSLRPMQVAVALANLGQILYFRQDYAAAYPLFIDTLRQTTRAGIVAQTEVNLGWILEEQNDPAPALEHYQRAAAVAGPKPYEIQVHLGLARVHRTLGHSAEAWQETQKAMELARDTPYKGLIGESFILLTEMQIARGETADAGETLKKALAYAREVNAEHIEMRALLTLGNLHYASGRFSDALRLAREAEAVWRKFDSPGNERYPILMLAARSELALGNEDAAQAAFGEAIAAVESVRGTLAGNQRQRVLYFEPYHAAYSEMVSLLLKRGRVEEALVYAERGKGRVLLDTLGVQRKDADELISEDGRKRRADMIRKLGEANRKVIVMRATDVPGASLDAAVAEQRAAQLALDAFDSDLEARQPRLRTARGEAAIIRTAALGELVARPDFAILEYVVHEGWTSLFLVERQGDAASVTHHRIDVTREALDRDLRAYSDRLAKRDLGYRDASRALYDLLLGPVAARLAGKRMLCIVPDGSLWHLPFESLVGPDRRFLVEHAAVFYVPSISVYREIISRRPHRRPGDRPLVAFGNPAIADVRERVVSVHRGADLGPLPDAEAEARTVGRIWGPGTAVYTGRDAREDIAKKEMSAARIVHFAAHGLFDDANPMFSQIVLARDAASQEDGVLQAWELMRLDLAADLVVLSACETARGRIGAGEGLIGMSWALFAGGCPSTVATHWKVGSAASSRLMVAFHQHLSRRDSKADALRAAQLLLLRDRATAHPFYWAGFVLIGAGRP